MRLLAMAVMVWVGSGAFAQVEEGQRLRVIVETDAGGDPDDEQSMVRFLLYTSEWDVEGIIANRDKARDGENKNPVRDGLGIVRRMLDAYGQVWPRLREHDRRFPTKEFLWQRTVAGYDNVEDGVELIIGAVDRADDPRPVWFLNWGTDHGAAVSSLRRALDRVLKERGKEGYAKFKAKLRLCSDNQFGPHTWEVEPAFVTWVYPFRPDMDGGRWYHRFSPLTKEAGGFDLKRDVLEGHGPLGPLYPTNTHLPQKEGDSYTFLYLIPNGLNSPENPSWGSWAGRFGKIKRDRLFPQDAGERNYWCPNVRDAIDGKAHRDHTLSKWAAHLQNDFRARMDWCVKGYGEANHPPVVVIDRERIRKARVADTIELKAEDSKDPDDGQTIGILWIFYAEASDYTGNEVLFNFGGARTEVTIPADAAGKSLHFIAVVTDDGDPPLTRYGRVVVEVAR